MVRTSNNGSKQDSATRASRRRRARRLQILSAAAQVFRKRGFAATGVREIAEAADLSPGNLYHYFSGKQELLFFCQEQSLENMLDALRSAERSGENAGSRLRQVIEAHVRCVLDEVQGSIAHLEVHALPAHLRRRLMAKRDRYERGVRALISDGIERGEFASCDPKLVAQAILGALNWTARWYRPDGSLTARDVGREFSDFLVRGLEATPRSRLRRR